MKGIEGGVGRERCLNGGFWRDSDHETLSPCNTYHMRPLVPVMHGMIVCVRFTDPGLLAKTF